MPWTTPSDIKTLLLKRWGSQALARAWLRDELSFPYALSIKRPARRELAERFSDVRAWIDALRARSSEQRAHGYRIEWEEANLRDLGAQQLPRRIVFDRPDDLFAFIGKTGEFKSLRRITDQTRARWLQAKSALAAAPFAALDEAERWDKIVAVLDYFERHPQPGRYLRELNIPGVDSKFIETRKPLLQRLLNAVLPPEACDAAQNDFEARFGLKSDPPLIRCRLLDPALYIQGLSDLSVPLEQFKRVHIAARTVFITENKINGLAFPDHPDALVIFGLGYGVQALFEVNWLDRCDLYYWGDIDTHGFVMLDRLRERFPAARSLLMDEATFTSCREFWVREPAPVNVDLPLLTAPEQALYRGLVTNRWGERLRLEQERIPFERVEHQLRRC